MVLATNTDNNDDLPNLSAQPKKVTPTTWDYDSLHSRFAWLPKDIIMQTFETMTQYARLPYNTILKKHFKSPNPALNVMHQNKPIATNTISLDMPAIDGGETYAQIFVGTKTLITDVYAMKSPAQFPGTLTDNITERGAPMKLISDRAQVEISKKVQEILCTLYIGSWQSEPHHQHQNPAEWHYQGVKQMVNTILDCTGALAYCWLLCLYYICFILNNSYSNNLKGTPLQYCTGITNDISPLLCFDFYEPVYFHMDDTPFPSVSKELHGHWVGISENVGNFMTFKVLTDDMLKVIHHSNVCSACDLASKNLCLDPLNENFPEVITSLQQQPVVVDSDSPSLDHGEQQVPMQHSNDLASPMAIIDPQDLIGRTFLMDERNDGQHFHAWIVKYIDKHMHNCHKTPEHMKFCCSINDDEYEDIILYNELMDIIQKNEENDTILWKFRRIIRHQGPLKPDDTHYVASHFNVKVEWENGETTYEPLNIIAADDPITCAIYARESRLLEEPSWRQFLCLARCEKHLLQLAKQAKIWSFKSAPQYKFGYLVPHDYNEALHLNMTNGNVKWQDTMKLEMQQLKDYECFKDVGIHGREPPPEGYKKIRVHFIFDVKHDGHHKAQCIAGGHLTDMPIDSIYSGVVSLWGLRMVAFISELNNLELWATDIGNAYLEALMTEKIYIMAGQEFGELEGHMLIIYKALCGLRSSGLRWSQRLSECLYGMEFTPSKAEPDIWM